MYRLFAGISVPLDIAEALQSISKNVPGASWRPLVNYHITLCFIGEVDREMAEVLDCELAKIIAPQMQLTLRSTGWFGSNEPRSIWAGVEPHPELMTLAKQCRSILRRFDVPLDKHPFTPHVTLAYCRGTHLGDATTFCEKNAGLSLGPFWADRFYLYSSRMRPGEPSTYAKEAEYPLGPMKV